MGSVHLISNRNIWGSRWFLRVHLTDKHGCPSYQHNGTMCECSAKNKLHAESVIAHWFLTHRWSNHRLQARLCFYQLVLSFGSRFSETIKTLFCMKKRKYHFDKTGNINNNAFRHYGVALQWSMRSAKKTNTFCSMPSSYHGCPT